MSYPLATNACNDQIATTLNSFQKYLLRNKATKTMNRNVFFSSSNDGSSNVESSAASFSTPYSSIYGHHYIQNDLSLRQIHHRHKPTSSSSPSTSSYSVLDSTNIKQLHHNQQSSSQQQLCNLIQDTKYYSSNYAKPPKRQTDTLLPSFLSTASDTMTTTPPPMSNNNHFDRILLEQAFSNSKSSFFKKKKYNEKKNPVEHYKKTIMKNQKQQHSSKDFSNCMNYVPRSNDVDLNILQEMTSPYLHHEDALLQNNIPTSFDHESTQQQKNFTLSPNDTLPHKIKPSAHSVVSCINNNNNNNNNNTPLSLSPSSSSSSIVVQPIIPPPSQTAYPLPYSSITLNQSKQQPSFFVYSSVIGIPSNNNTHHIIAPSSSTHKNASYSYGTNNHPSVLSITKIKSKRKNKKKNILKTGVIDFSNNKPSQTPSSSTTKELMLLPPHFNPIVSSSSSSSSKTLLLSSSHSVHLNQQQESILPMTIASGSSSLDPLHDNIIDVTTTTTTAHTKNRNKNKKLNKLKSLQNGHQLEKNQLNHLYDISNEDLKYNKNNDYRSGSTEDQYKNPSILSPSSFSSLQNNNTLSTTLPSIITASSYSMKFPYVNNEQQQQHLNDYNIKKKHKRKNDSNPTTSNSNHEPLQQICQDPLLSSQCHNNNNPSQRIITTVPNDLNEMQNTPMPIKPHVLENDDKYSLNFSYYDPPEYEQCKTESDKRIELSSSSSFYHHPSNTTTATQFPSLNPLLFSAANDNHNSNQIHDDETNLQQQELEEQDLSQLSLKCSTIQGKDVSLLDENDEPSSIRLAPKNRIEALPMKKINPSIIQNKLPLLLDPSEVLAAAARYERKRQQKEKLCSPADTEKRRSFWNDDNNNNHNNALQQKRQSMELNQGRPLFQDAVAKHSEDILTSRCIDNMTTATTIQQLSEYPMSLDSCGTTTSFSSKAQNNIIQKIGDTLCNHTIDHSDSLSKLCDKQFLNDDDACKFQDMHNENSSNINNNTLAYNSKMKEEIVVTAKSNHTDNTTTPLPLDCVVSNKHHQSGIKNYQATNVPLMPSPLLCNVTDTISITSEISEKQDHHHQKISLETDNGKPTTTKTLSLFGDHHKEMLNTSKSIYAMETSTSCNTPTTISLSPSLSSLTTSTTPSSSLYYSTWYMHNSLKRNDKNYFISISRSIANSMLHFVTSVDHELATKSSIIRNRVLMALRNEIFHYFKTSEPLADYLPLKTLTEAPGATATPPMDVLVFGSCSTNLFLPWSDVDVVITGLNLDESFDLCHSSSASSSSSSSSSTRLPSSSQYGNIDINHITTAPVAGATTPLASCHETKRNISKEASDMRLNVLTQLGEHLQPENLTKAFIGCLDDNTLIASQNKLKDKLSQNMVDSSQLKPSRFTPILTLNFNTNYMPFGVPHHIDISIQHNKHSGMNALKTLKFYLSFFPTMRGLILVLKQLLMRRHMNIPYEGGLSSYALSLMVVAFLQSPELYDSRMYDAGYQLLSFLAFYGNISVPSGKAVHVATHKPPSWTSRSLCGNNSTLLGSSLIGGDLVETAIDDNTLSTCSFDYHTLGITPALPEKFLRSQSFKRLVVLMEEQKRNYQQQHTQIDDGVDKQNLTDSFSKENSYDRRKKGHVIKNAAAYSSKHPLPHSFNISNEFTNPTKTQSITSENNNDDSCSHNDSVGRLGSFSSITTISSNATAHISNNNSDTDYVVDKYRQNCVTATDSTNITCSTAPTVLPSLPLENNENFTHFSEVFYLLSPQDAVFVKNNQNRFSYARLDIRDPTDASNNVGRPCWNTCGIKATFAYAYQDLLLTKQCNHCSFEVPACYLEELWLTLSSTTSLYDKGDDQDMENIIREDANYSSPNHLNTDRMITYWEKRLEKLYTHLAHRETSRHIPCLPSKLLTGLPYTLSSFCSCKDILKNIVT